MDGQAFLDRFAGVLRLDRGTYEGIERDGEAANGQALLVVVLTGLLSGIGTAASFGQGIAQNLAPDTDPDAVRALAETDALLGSPGGRVMVIVLSVLLSVVFWYVYAAVARWAGRTLFGADPAAADGAQLRNLIGWGYAPGLLNVFGAVPVIGGLFSLVGGVWALVTGVVAVRTGLGISTGRAIGTVLVAALLPGILLGCACVAVMFALLAATGAV